MTNGMKHSILLIALSQTILCNAQVANREIRTGNKEYNKKAFSEAEIHYRKALEKNPDSEKATYNLGDALYKQDQFEPSITKFESLTKGKSNAADQPKYYYNLGNAYFKTQKLDKAIEAYKQCLRIDPKDMDAKHNLFLAENMQKQQKNQKDQQNKDQKDQNDKDKKDQQKNQDQQKDQQQKQNQENQQEKQNQNKSGKEQQISKEDAERLLEALEQDEKSVLKKLEDQKMQGRKIPVEKEW
jgi:Ca-activated chloride channel homolog